MRDYLIMLDDVKARTLAEQGASAEEITEALVKGGVDARKAKSAAVAYLEAAKKGKKPEAKTPKAPKGKADGEGEKAADPLA